MEAFTHWQLGNSRKVDGAEFHVDDKELGHIHLNGDVHLYLTRKISRALIQKGFAQRVPWGDDWVTAPTTTATEEQRAVWLFRLGYDRLRDNNERELLERIVTA